MYLVNVLSQYICVVNALTHYIFMYWHFFPTDSALILDASLASSRYLTRNPYLTWTELMDKQLTDVALCGVMYHNPILVGTKNLACP